MLLDEYLLQDPFYYWVGWDLEQQETPEFKITTRNLKYDVVRGWSLPGLSGEGFWGESTIIELGSRSRSLCKRGCHERLIGYFGRIE